MESQSCLGLEKVHHSRTCPVGLEMTIFIAAAAEMFRLHSLARSRIPTHMTTGPSLCSRCIYTVKGVRENTMFGRPRGLMRPRYHHPPGLIINQRFSETLWSIPLSVSSVAAFAGSTEYRVLVQVMLQCYSPESALRWESSSNH
jgi:hypothetical protein